jgi:hypothetical protein
LRSLAAAVAILIAVTSFPGGYAASKNRNDQKTLAGNAYPRGLLRPRHDRHMTAETTRSEAPAWPPPTGSRASIQFDSGRSTVTAGIGALQILYLIVDDILPRART